MKQQDSQKTVMVPVPVVQVWPEGGQAAVRGLLQLFKAVLNAM